MLTLFFGEFGGASLVDRRFRTIIVELLKEVQIRLQPGAESSRPDSSSQARVPMMSRD